MINVYTRFDKYKIIGLDTTLRYSTKPAIGGLIRGSASFTDPLASDITFSDPLVSDITFSDPLSSSITYK
jgi:hypothetical protein